MADEDGFMWLLPYITWLMPFAFLYWLVFAGEFVRQTTSPYSLPAWHFTLKRLWALLAVRRLKAARAQRLARRPKEGDSDQLAEEMATFIPTEYDRRLEAPRLLLAEGVVDSLCFHGADFDSNSLIIRVTRMRHCLSRLALQLKVGDRIYQLPQLPDSLVSRTGSDWSAGGAWGGLRIQVVEALRKWRFAFNGVLREGRPRGLDWDGTPGDQDSLRHVRFNFIWTACSPVYNCRHDWSAELLAETIAREPWRTEKWMDIIKGHVGGYDQWGTLLGEVHVEDGDSQVLNLRGLRQRRWGPNEAGRLHRRITVNGILKNGAMFSVGADCHPGQLSHATYGHVRAPDGQLHAIDWTSLNMPQLAEDREAIPRHFVLLFTAGGERYTSAVHLPRQAGCTVMCERPWSWLMLLEPTECSLEWGRHRGRSVQQGVGLAELCYRYDGPCPLPAAHPAPLLQLRESKVSGRPLVLGLGERSCRSSDMVGGKGASLAALTALLQADGDLAYRVPAGFCLTVVALEQQLAKNPALHQAVDRLVEAAGDQNADLAARCEEVTRLFAATAVCEEVAEEVRASLQRLEEEALRDLVRDSDHADISWAVRSSAVGEDSEELSAAGQNATLLGCRGADGVLDGVRRCWSSLYTLQSVQYRRQHAQLVAAPMAVVVQRMVPADKAGVLFTCDPTTGDPRRLLITANYGLGESVVSAAVDPDMVVVLRNLTGEVRVAERTSGGKQLRVVLSETGGVREETGPGQQGDGLCVSDAEVLQLARVGARIEAAFGGPRDVEWAFRGGQLYLLQARPVTAIFNWTDFELLHELDAPVVTDEDVTTTANTGEVLPGATSPLGQSMVVRALDRVTLKAAARDLWTKSYFYNRTVPTSQHHVLINVLNLLLRKVDKKIDLGIHTRDLCIFGHKATTERTHQVAIQMHGVTLTGLEKLRLTAHAIGRSWCASRSVAHARQLAQDLDVDVRAERETTAVGVLRCLHRAVPVLVEAFLMHAHMSNVSGFSQSIAIAVLAEGAEDLSTEHLTDVATMLTCTGGDVVSAEIPTAMRNVAVAIRDNSNWQDFVALRPEQGMSWLKEHAPAAHGLVIEFLAKYGHRVIREFDPATVTWEEDPALFMASLQTLVPSQQGTAATPSSPTTMQEIIQKLKSPRRSSTKFVLRYLLPWFQSCVANREYTKEAGIRVINKLRRALRRLAALMEKEGRLPDRALANFLTYWELYQLLQGQPDPGLIAKARWRRRRWPEWDSLLFPEVIHGLPTPLQFDDVETQSGTVAARGTPVSEFSVTARACVVLTLAGDQGISQLRAGDVLITHSTDVGWSPYFPMLGGVVTELGGLISHGAVVAREYGLPCLVGVNAATRIFKTGDKVKINGKTGELLKVE